MNITDSTFKETIANNQVVVVDFWAEWCGPCKALSPIIEELEQEYDGKAIVGKLDVEENPDVCEEFGIRNIPTILIFKDGEIADKIVGATKKDSLKASIDKLL